MSADDSRLEEAARRVAEQLPPLTEEQRNRIAALLAPALDVKDVQVDRAPAPGTHHRGQAAGEASTGQAGGAQDTQRTTSHSSRADGDISPRRPSNVRVTPKCAKPRDVREVPDDDVRVAPRTKTI